MYRNPVRYIPNRPKWSLTRGDQAAASPITDSDRTRARELHEQGKTRNDIAKTLGRSPSTVSKLARELGLSFARSHPRSADGAGRNRNHRRSSLLRQCG
ncbi:helix-turn-helix domain-containing protein [Saccharopolyspora sp. NPDC002376]